MQAPEGRRYITAVELRSSLEHGKLRQETLAMLVGKNIGMLATYVRGKDDLRQGRGKIGKRPVRPIMDNKIIGHHEGLIKKGTTRLNFGMAGVRPRDVVILE